MNFNFGEVLTRAWQIIWKHKVLWIFGVLASCGRGGGGNGGGGNSGSSGGNGGGFGQPDLPPQVMRWFQTIEENMTTVIVVGLALICIIWVITIFLSTIGKIGLIRGTQQAEGGAESLIFGQLFSESTPYFWRIFGLSLIVALPFLVVFAALFAGLIVFAISASGGNDTAGLGILAMMPVFLGCLCLLVPVMIVVNMIIRQSERAIVLEEMSVMPALSRGWEIFRKNLGAVILMAIILGVIGFIIGLVIAIPVIAIVFPTTFAYFMGGAQSTTPLIFMGVCMCLYIPIALVLQGIMVAYTESAWTLTYMQLTKPQDNAPVVLEANA